MSNGWSSMSVQSLTSANRCGIVAIVKSAGSPGDLVPLEAARHQTCGVPRTE